MTGYLDAIGTVRDSVIAIGRDIGGEPTRASLYLYDLSDSTRIRSALAAATGLPTAPELDPRLRCATDISG